MELTGAPSRICERSGLVLVEQPDVALWRVFKTADGPLNPPIRSGSPDERWGRFDVPGVATLYGATHSRGAYVETLAVLAPAEVDYADLFDDVAPGQDPVAQDWSDMHHMPPGSAAAQWRRDRQMCEMLLLRSGQYIDVMAGDTISTLRRHFEEWAPNQDPRYRRIDASLLTGPDRMVTCAVAQWLIRQVLDDGSIPAGVRYVSRHGGELPCWAIWVDLEGTTNPDDVKPLVERHITEVNRTPIEATDADFRWAATSLGVTAH